MVYALKLPLMILLGAFINTPTEESMNSFVYIGNSSRISLRMNSINGSWIDVVHTDVGFIPHLGTAITDSSSKNINIVYTVIAFD